MLKKQWKKRCINSRTSRKRFWFNSLGNAIRRILLIILQGAAITSIKIKGVVHEFSTIPGVKEDLTDILIKLKTIAVKVHSPGLKKCI